MTEVQPQMNGPSGDAKYIDQIDPEDPQYIKEMQRPAEVKEDVRQMEHRKRVSLILNSQAFKDELEEIVDEQIKSGTNPDSLMALQSLAELFVTPQTRFNQSGSTGGNFSRSTGPVIPIADIRGVDSLNYAKGERTLRCKLAATYRLVDLYGWSQIIYNHITVRINQDNEHFLINPFGMLYHEITASSLVKVDMQGDILDPGTTSLGINKAGYTLHSAIHTARPEIRAAIHVHTPAVIAVSVMKCGLLPISQQACVLGDLTYYDYTGLLFDNSERERLARILGPVSKVMFLRNHGVITCGESLEEAFHLLSNVIEACETQVKLLPVGLDNITLIPEDVQKRVYEQSQISSSEDQGQGDGKYRWKAGELEFEAHMRHLDNAGFRSGYIYRDPLIKRGNRDRANHEMELPPTSTSFTYMYDDDRDLSKYSSPIKQAIEKQKKQFKSEWLNTPNVYKKEEIEETGTPNTKKITKWVSEESSPTQTSTPIKLDTPNQFAPQGDNPKELRNKQKQIRGDYYTDKISAGPQSPILEGASWDEAQKLKDGNVSGTSDSVIVVGAASKGIIQREHQHSAVVYKTSYASNPFDNLNEEEIETYKREIQARSGTEEPEPLTEEVIQPVQQSHVERIPAPVQYQAPARSVPQETNIDDVLMPAEPITPIRRPVLANKYKVSVYTGDKWGAGTDANVAITIFGEASKSEETKLDNKKDNFERNKVDEFIVECPNLGRVEHIRIGHDDSTMSSGWYLGKVIIKDMESGTVYEFPCNRWMAKDEDDGAVVRDLQCRVGSADVTPGGRDVRRSLSNREAHNPEITTVNGDEPGKSDTLKSKSDTLKSTSSGEEVKYQDDHGKEKKKKKKFRMPSFSKKKEKK